VAAERGIPLREFVTEAVQDKLEANSKPTDKPWMLLSASSSNLRKETARINRIIEEEFEKIEPEDWQRFWTQTHSQLWPRASNHWNRFCAKPPRLLFP
jgi:hypothetical protein